MFLLAWTFLGAAIAILYLGLSEEGRTFLYLSMAASAVTALLAIAQLFRRVRPRSGPESGWDPGGPADEGARRPADVGSEAPDRGSPSPGSSRPG